MLDIGGESSRPGAEPVSLEEELRRVIPVVEALAPRVDVPISVDTTKAEVARQALQAGAAIVNDISALGADPRARTRGRRGGRGGRADAHAGDAPHDAGRPALRRRGRARSATFLARRIAWAEAIGNPPRADRDRPGDRLRQDDRAQPGALAEPRSICQPGMCGPGRHLAQGVPRGVDRPAGGASGRRPSVASSLAAAVRGSQRRPGPRRRADGRCDQGLDRHSRLGRGYDEPGDRGRPDCCRIAGSWPTGRRPPRVGWPSPRGGRRTPG